MMNTMLVTGSARGVRYSYASAKVVVNRLMTGLAEKL